MAHNANNLDSTDFDLVDVINTTLPFEKHLPGNKYLGPGTDLAKKLDSEGKPKPGYEPTNKVDYVAYLHDLQYSRHEDFKSRRKADSNMLNDLREIENPTCTERCLRFIVYPIMWLKSVIGTLILRIIGDTM